MGAQLVTNVTVEAQLRFPPDHPTFEVDTTTYQPVVLQMEWSRKTGNGRTARWVLMAHPVNTPHWHVISLTPYEFGDGGVPGWLTDLVAEHAPNLDNVWKD